MAGLCAPQQADRLEQLWAGMPEPGRRALLWEWLDLMDASPTVKFNLKRIGFMMVMLSRFAFGDDRLVTVMERQIAERQPGAC